MTTTPHWPCQCRNWTRCEPIDLKGPGSPNHHSACEHFNASLIDVWRVSLDGTSYVNEIEGDAREELNALLADDPDCGATITKEQMHREVFERLPEFDGF